MAALVKKRVIGSQRLRQPKSPAPLAKFYIRRTDDLRPRYWVKAGHPLYPAYERLFPSRKAALAHIKTLEAQGGAVARRQAVMTVPRVTREMWQMTRAEYTAGLDGPRLRISTQGHREHVVKALAAGKPVPTGVLKDYPDLAKAAARASERAFDAAVAKAIEQGRTPSTYRIPGTEAGGMDSATANRLRGNAYKRVQFLRQRIKDLGPRAGHLRLDLLNAESEWKELLRIERQATASTKAAAKKAKMGVESAAATAPWWPRQLGSLEKGDIVSFRPGGAGYEIVGARGRRVLLRDVQGRDQSMVAYTPVTRLAGSWEEATNKAIASISVKAARG